MIHQILVALLIVVQSVSVTADSPEVCPAKLPTTTCGIQNTNCRCAKEYPECKTLHWSIKRRILVTGGAGFVGSHLVDRLMKAGHEVIVVDNFVTGHRHNIEHWIGHENFELIRHDVTEPIFIQADEIYHLASPASPPQYMLNPIRTVKANTLGTINLLGVARRTNAKFLFASTSEVYGDPEVHPQPETYWGNVNPIGPRACYDESKRLAETITYAYAERNKISVRIARIFNTYGPRMQLNDGRVVSNFIIQALTNKPMTIYGSGEQTRSFQYVSDLVEGLIRLMASNYSLPVNLGNPDEFTVIQLADMVREYTNSTSTMDYLPKPVDDPQRRRPVIEVAARELDWHPIVKLREGLADTVAYFRDYVGRIPEL